MPYVPGNAAEGYCGNCKQDTVQTVLEVEGLQVRLARCEKCGSEAPLKITRHQTREGLRAALQKKKRSVGTTTRQRKQPVDPAVIFRQNMVGRDMSAARDYSVKMRLVEGDIIRHSRFGVGVVTTIQESSKAVVSFEDGEKTLVFGRG